MKLDDVKKLAQITNEAEKILRKQIDEKYKILKELGYSDRVIYKLLAENTVIWQTLRNFHLNNQTVTRNTLLRLIPLVEGHDNLLEFAKYIDFHRALPRKRVQNPIRDKNILNEWNNNPNSTLQSIADRYGMSRERIRQIVHNCMLDGEYVRTSVSKTKQRKSDKEKKLIKEIEIGLKHYGTTKYFEWRKLFLKGPDSILRSQTLRKHLMKRWNQDLDPLFNFQISIELKPIHYKILDLKKDGKTLDQICEILNKSKPSITNYLRDLREHGLVEHVNPTQVNAVSASDCQIQKQLDLIRDDLRKGGNMNDVRHYVRRHFLYPYYVRQKKETLINFEGENI